MSIYNSAADTSNPKKGHHLKDIAIRDPFIYADVETYTYYLYGPGMTQYTDLERDGVLVYKSKDLLEWEGPYVVFTVPEDTWAHPQHGAWASEVHKYQEKFYLFVTLHNKEDLLASPPEVWQPNHMRGTAVAVADSPMGPFELLKTDGPQTPKEFMALDGTLYQDENDQPWMVYCHEWVQVLDGTIEAIRLKEDLTETIGDPIHLFKGSDAPWLNEERKPGTHHTVYITDGCQTYRTKDGQLLMLWSSFNNEGYVQTIARSKSGKLEGPWEQLDPLVYSNSGHGMMFETFDGELMLILYHPSNTPEVRAKIYQMEDTGDKFKVVNERSDLYGK